MNICDKINPILDNSVFQSLEKEYNLTIPECVKAFFEKENSGIPRKRYVSFHGEDYEVRSFLSMNSNDEYSIFEPLKYFQEKTHGKIVPIAIDSGDNYYCLNLQYNKMYYWSSDADLYYELADSFSEFLAAFLS